MPESIKNTCIRLLVLLVLATCELASAIASEGLRTSAQLPNIVLILVDDLGYGDVNLGMPEIPVFNNTFVKTPNLAKLARQSLLMTDHYAASPVCSPSRVGLLTGRTPTRSDVMLYIDDLASNEKSFLHGSEMTLAELLKQANYRTGVVGKWHLNGADWEDPNAWTGWTGSFPSQQGFDEGMVSKENPHFTRQLLVNTQKHPGDFFRVDGSPVGPIKGYTSDIISQQASQMMENWCDKKDGRPFFLYLSYDAVHIRVAAADQYEAMYSTGDARRDAYYANISHVDAAIGEVLNKLEQLQIADNTIVIFTSDNGPDVQRNVDFSSFCFGTAFPLRGAKYQLYEGGIRVPGMIRWPGKIAPRISNVPNGTLDLMPTLAEVANVPLPKDRAFDGTSLLDHWLTGAKPNRKQPLYWQFEDSKEFPEIVGEGYERRLQGKAIWKPARTPVASIREDNWVLIAFGDQATKQPTQFQLYDLHMDLDQKQDAASSEPRRFDRMKTTLLGIHAHVHRDREKSKAAIANRESTIVFP
jgi:arylsulfatase A